MNQIIPQNFGAMSARFQGVQTDDELSSGVQGGFGLIGYRGKVWSIRYHGEERQLMRPNNEGPQNSIELVIVKASPVISKIFYEQGWVEGSTAAPDCFSTNGVTPDAGANKKQATTCATCPKNAWGSRITPAGKQGKACQDSKRLAVVPLNDMKNEVFGGPMLLRVPAASLQDMSYYGKAMGQLGYPSYAIGTRVSFDHTESYPKFIFNPIRPLTDAEAEIVLKLRDSVEVARILAASPETAPVAAIEAPQPAFQFEQPPAQPAPAAPQAQPTPAPTPVQSQPTPAQPTVVSGFGGVMEAPAPATPQPAPAPAPVPAPAMVEAAPVVTTAGKSQLEMELDAKLEALLPK